VKRNSFLFGCALGLFAPVVAYLLKSFTALGTMTHPLTLYVIAALINLLLIRFFYRNALDRSAMGIVLITFIALLVLILIGKLSLA